MVRAARAPRRESRSRAARLTPDSASRGWRSRPAAMSGRSRHRTSRWYHDPFVRWTSGRLILGAGSPVDMTDKAATRELPKAYVPAEFEGRIYERWLAADVFAPDGAGSTADTSLPPFTIIQPPPNITGSLHLGHAQRTAVEDLLIRHARMQGHATLFL